MQALKMVISCKLIGALLFGLIIIIQLTVLCDARRRSHCTNRTTTRVVDGVEVKEQEYNEHVVLKIQHPEGMELCGGVLVEPNIVLTAAHCIKKYVNEPNMIQVSSSQFEPSSWSLNDLSHAVEPEKICISKKYWYGFGREYNDYGVMRLEDKVYNFYLGKLATKETKIGEKVVAVGVGYTSIDLKNPANNKRAKKLRKLDMERVKCFDYDQHQSHVCFTSVRGGDTCYGDSGSPVFDQNQVVVGITSYGDDKSPCQHGVKVKSVYADIARNRELIDGLIEECKSYRDETRSIKRLKKEHHHHHRHRSN